MTSNAGSGEDQKGGLGFFAAGRKGAFYPRAAAAVQPGVLGRIDCVACFEKLGPAELTQIAKRQLEALSKRAKSRGLTLEIAPGAAEEIARQAMEKPGGARNIRHLLQTLVQTPLSDALLSGTPPKALRFWQREGKIVVSVTDGDDRKHRNRTSVQKLRNCRKGVKFCKYFLRTILKKGVAFLC